MRSLARGALLFLALLASACGSDAQPPASIATADSTTSSTAPPPSDDDAPASTNASVAPTSTTSSTSATSEAISESTAAPTSAAPTQPELDPELVSILAEHHPLALEVISSDPSGPEQLVELIDSICAEVVMHGGDVDAFEQAARSLRPADWFEDDGEFARFIGLAGGIACRSEMEELMEAASG